MHAEFEARSNDAAPAVCGAGPCRRRPAAWNPALRVLFCLLTALLFLAPQAAPQIFGQNKVPRRQYQWRVLHSEHFDLHFYPEEREAAEAAVSLAERAYERLSRIYGHEFQLPIPIILYSSQTEFRETRAAPGLIGEGTGGLTELMKRRVILPFTGSYAELDYVITHELSHAFQLDILSHSRFGQGLQPISWTPPLWVMEGLSEYVATPGTNAHTEMWMRDAVQEGAQLSVDMLSRMRDIRVYRYGQSLVSHIARSFGDEAVGQWFRRIARGRNLATGTQESIGLTLDRLSAEWADSLRRRYLPEVIEHDRAGEDARRLTDHTKARSSLYIAPAISPDGGEMVFITNSSFYTDIHIASALDGSHERRLLRGQRKESFETFRYIRTSLGWSPDGDRIALVTRNSGREVLVVYNVRKRKVEREMALGLDEMFSPTWSPDGEWIAFEGLREARSNLYKVAAKGDSLVQLTHDRWATFQPAWSPDGRRIAFVTDRGYRSATGFEFFSPWRIAILNLESSDIALLPGQVGKTINPQWFPDNRHLLFISDRTRISNMFIRDLDTGLDYQITDVMTGISGITERGVAASLSARGNRVVFSVFEKMGWNLYAIRDPLGRVDTVEPWEPEPGAEPPVVEADTERSIPLVAAMVGEEGGAGFTAHQIMVAGAPPTWMKGGEGTPEGASAPSSEQTEASAEQSTGSAGQATTGLQQGEAAGQNAETSTEAGEDPPTGSEGRPFEDRPRPGKGHDDVTAGNGAPEHPEPVDDIRDLFLETSTLPESLKVEEMRYRPRFTLDYAYAGGIYTTGFGMQAQSTLVFSDMLGDKNIYIAADVRGSLANGSYLLGYANLGTRPSFNVAIFQRWSGYGYGPLPGYLEDFENRFIRGGGVDWIHPFSRFRRLEMGVDLTHERRYRYMHREVDSIEGGLVGVWEQTYRDGWYLNPAISWVFDSSVFGPTGPLSGRRTRLTGYASFGEESSQGITLDHRLYFNINQYYAFVWRGVAAGEWGPGRHRLIFGGPYSLRGHSDQPLVGTKVAYMNFEFRFPFIDGLLVAWPLPLMLGGIRGAVFFDVGAAWENPRDFRPWVCEGGSCTFRSVKSALGLRLAINMGLAIIRWDLVRRSELSRWAGRSKSEFSLGWEF